MSKFFEILFNLIDLFHQKRIKNFYKKYKVDFLIDCGAHKGEYLTTMQSLNLKMYFAIEPQKKAFQILKIKFLLYRNIEFFNIACGTKKDFANFYLNYLSSTSSLSKPNAKTLYMKFKKILLGGKLIKKKIKVRIDTIDNIVFRKIKPYKNGILKIDVEGTEYNVLKGALCTLKSKKILFVQVENLYFNQSKNYKINLLLKKYNYKKIKDITYPTLHFSDQIFILNV